MALELQAETSEAEAPCDRGYSLITSKPQSEKALALSSARNSTWKL